jgi:hypothetical protein
MCQFHPDLTRALVEERQQRVSDRLRTHTSWRPKRPEATTWQVRQRAYVVASLISLRKGDEPR